MRELLKDTCLRMRCQWLSEALTCLLPKVCDDLPRQFYPRKHFTVKGVAYTEKASPKAICLGHLPKE